MSCTTTKTRRELGQRGRLRGIEVFRRLRIQAPEEIDIEAIAFTYGLRVYDGGLSGAQGRLASNGKQGKVRIANGITQEPRRRYIIAHELGHHLVHAAQGKLLVCTAADLLKYDSNGDTEEEANWFAAELLMPKPLFEPDCDVRQPTFAIVERLSKKFGTTLTATAIRFVRLCPEACAVVWSEAGAIKWAVRGDDFYPWIEFGKRLDSHTHAADVSAGKPVPKGPQVVPARAWTDKGSGDLYEETLAFGGLGAALSLLWLPPE
jgi:Zn-dependent peptidase ImmA (M78 family)